MNVRKIYEYALAREKQGREFFQTNAARMSHAAAVGIFQRLAQEEERHIEFIEELLQALDEGNAVREAPFAPGQDELFAARAQSEMIDQTVVESMVPDVAILRMAYLIERDFAEFYEAASLKAGAEAQSVLNRLARWERGHERLFKDLHDRVFTEYAEMPWGG